MTTKPKGNAQTKTPRTVPQPKKAGSLGQGTKPQRTITLPDGTARAMQALADFRAVIFANRPKGTYDGCGGTNYETLTVNEASARLGVIYAAHSELVNSLGDINDGMLQGDIIKWVNDAAWADMKDYVVSTRVQTSAKAGGNAK